MEIRKPTKLSGRLPEVNQGYILNLNKSTTTKIIYAYDLLRVNGYLAGKKNVDCCLCSPGSTVFFCVIYASDHYHADGTAVDALVTDGAVEVNQNIKDMIVFLPKDPAAGLIFYPGLFLMRGKREWKQSFVCTAHSGRSACAIIIMPMNGAWRASAINIQQYQEPCFRYHICR